MSFYTLGIETSCDETAAAVLKDDREVLSNIVYSQAEIHSKTGGVVPEVASRDHIRKISLVVDEAISTANISLEEIDLIGATQGPGLVGCLLVGLTHAKGLAYGLKKPLVGVNHLEGHIFAHHLEHGEAAAPPFVALIVSGGHTSLIHVSDWGNYEILGETRDDAAGEAFDKVGKLMGLGYPAGIHIDRLSKEGNPSAISFPRPMLDGTSYEFSFAGLKTAVIYHLRDHPDSSQVDMAASFQEAVVEVLVKKSMQAARDLNLSKIVVVGGVAANSRIRSMFDEQQADLNVYFPALSLCTDNAAMIATAARHHFKKTSEHSNESALSLSPDSSLRF